MEGRLLLHLNCGEDICEVQINNEKPLILPWHPYNLDVTPYLHNGRNKISLSVTNTLVNILEAEPRPSGLKNRPFIEHQHRYIFEVGDKRNE
jgi:hypothetical protein